MEARIILNHDMLRVQMCIVNNVGDVTGIPPGQNIELVIKPAEELVAYAESLEAQGYETNELRTFIEDYEAGAFEQSARRRP